jgi:sec-independent protein translocase protein TatA
MGLDNPIHIAFLVLILLLVFGAKRLPELGRSLGTGMREFKQSVTGEAHAAEKPQQPMLTAAAAAAPPPAETPAAQPAPAAAQPPPAAMAQPAPAEAAPAEQQQQS